VTTTTHLLPIQLQYVRRQGLWIEPHVVRRSVPGVVRAGEQVGHPIARLVVDKRRGVGGGRMRPLPFEELIEELIVPATGRMRPRKVNVDGETYECARCYMIRLDKSDFEDPERLAALAAAAGKSPEQIRQRFGHLVD